MAGMFKGGIGSIWSHFGLQITFIAYKKSYMAIICPNSHANWSQFEHGSKSLVWPLGSHIWSLLAPIHMQSFPKVKLGQV